MSLGNKIDLSSRAVSKEEAEDFAKEKQMVFVPLT